MINELQVNVRSCKERPKYSKTAAELLAACREFYQDPENEKAFQEWMKERRGKGCRSLSGSQGQTGTCGSMRAGLST